MQEGSSHEPDCDNVACTPSTQLKPNATLSKPSNQTRHLYAVSPSIGPTSPTFFSKPPHPPTPSKPQPPPHPVPDNPLIVGPPLPPHLRRLDIRRALIVRLRQHTHHADQDLLHALYRTPALGRVLVVVRIVARWVQDRDADEACWVDYSSPPKSPGCRLAFRSSSRANDTERQGGGEVRKVPFGCQTSPKNRITGGLSG